MNYATVCSGIEAPSTAWHGLGWKPVFVSEIEAAPCQILHHHYGSGRPQFLPPPPPADADDKEQRRYRAQIKALMRLPDRAAGAPPNLGDMLQIHNSEDFTNAIGSVDLLCGGTPCQSFSVAGLRKGLDDPRGNLALGFLAIAERLRARWILWENVPGVLSSSGGRDFGAFLGALGKLGYGWAYRVLDAQYIRTHGFSYAVPQRRRRVFVVGHLGSWQRAAAVLFDSRSMSGDPAPRRQAGQAVAGTLNARTGAGGGLGTDAELDGGLIPEITGAVTSKWAKGSGGPSGDECQNLVIDQQPIAFDAKRNASDSAVVGVAPTLRAANNHKGNPNSGDTLAVAYDTTQITQPSNGSNPQPGDPCHSLSARAHPPLIAFKQAIAFQERGRPEGRTIDAAEGVSYALTSPAGGNRTQEKTIVDVSNMVVRRLTPLECERLQGFPDGYTRIPVRIYSEKPSGIHFEKYGDLYDEQPDGTWVRHMADGPRYRALGNSMAVNVMRLIGLRFQYVTDLVGGNNDGE